MTRTKISNTIRSIISLGLVLTVVAAPVANAHPGHDHDEPTSTPSAETKNLDAIRDKAEQKIKETLEKAREKRDAEEQKTVINTQQLRAKLDDAKKKLCSNRRDTINATMNAMNDRRQKAYDRITKVFESAKTYTSEKNLSVASYDSLVASAVAAQSAAKTTLTTQKSAPEVNCNSDQPRADIAGFKEKRLASIDAMKAYRDSVKQLVAAIKLAAETKDR